MKEEFQPVSDEIFKLKYAAPGENRDNVYARVAGVLSRNENERMLFYHAMKKHGCIPAGRILANIGRKDKPKTSTINCTVAGVVEDSIEGIMENVKNAATTLAAGCGIGYEFSTIRPRGAHVVGAGASTSGPIPFMDIFDSMCKTISSAGGRRGAQMAVFDVYHPDILEFINAKKEAGRLRQFNCSVLVDNAFMQAVKDDKKIDLSFPIGVDDNLTEKKVTVRRMFPSVKHNSYITDSLINAPKLTKCLVYETLPARIIWDAIMETTYEYAEPGILFLDHINKANPLAYVRGEFNEYLRTCNPCGEQMLPNHGSCLLGSIDLTKYIKSDAFDFIAFARQVQVFAVMLDRVIDHAGLPLAAQTKEINDKRRHGMGITGLGSMLNLIGITYGSPEAVNLTKEICKTLAMANLVASIKTAAKDGCCPALEDSSARHQFQSSGYISKVLSAIEHSPIYYSEYDDLTLKIQAFGFRWTHGTSIAPTGTISLAMCNNVSNGIEPTFAHQYKRNIIKEGQNTKEQQTVYSYEAFIKPNVEPDEWIDAYDVSPSEHVHMQAAAQEWIDSAVSKTINLPQDTNYDFFKSVYMEGWELGCKGITTYRHNPGKVGTVLVTEEDQNRNTYQFTLETGETHTLKGGDQVVYDGAIHTAANLFEALNEGQYGKF